MLQSILLDGRPRPQFCAKKTTNDKNGRLVNKNYQGRKHPVLQDEQNSSGRPSSTAVGVKAKIAKERSQNQQQQRKKAAEVVASLPIIPPSRLLEHSSDDHQDKVEPKRLVISKAEKEQRPPEESLEEQQDHYHHLQFQNKDNKQTNNEDVIMQKGAGNKPLGSKPPKSPRSRSKSPRPPFKAIIPPPASPSTTKKVIENYWEHNLQGS